MLDLLPDLFDMHSDKLYLVRLPLMSYGGKSVFYGEVVTVKCFEDNSKVKQILATDGHGKVLVVDGGGSLDKALLGDLIAQSAVDNGWEGVIIAGAVRDVGTIATLALGVKALGCVPIKTQRRDLGEIDVPLMIGNVQITPGMYLYADLNGVAVSHTALSITL